MRIYDNLYDVIIIGGGPAGLSAAIYASRAKEKVLVIENNEFGGQIALSAMVENYPGVLPCSGRELTDLMKDQAREFGAELVYNEVTGLELESRIKKVFTVKGTYRALSVILAPGGKPGQAGFEGEEKYKGSGVSYCPTCDGPLFAGCPIYVVGGGPAAVEESIFLAGLSPKVTMVIRGNHFSCDRSFYDRLKQYPDIRILFHTEIVSVSGDMILDTVTLRDNMSEKVWEEKSEEDPIGVFVFVGYHPNTEWLPEALERDEAGYLLTDAQCRTNIQGVSAAGDVRQKTVRQVVTAAGDGAIAAVSLEPLIRELHEELEIPDLVKDSSNIIEEITDKVILEVWLDESEHSQEMEEFLQTKEELKGRADIRFHREAREDMMLPAIEICRSDGNSSGIIFHAVPKGLEWNSFQIAMFNVSGSGQKISPDTMSRIMSIKEKVHLKVLATLTCGNCPTSVMAACLIAAFNENVTAEIFDILQFKKLYFRYQVQSVPVLIINEEKKYLGRMEVEEMLDAIER